MWVRFPPLLPLTVYKYSVIIVLCPGDGIGIRVGLRSQILRVRVSPWAPYNAAVAQLVEHHVANVNVTGSNPVSRSKFC